MEQILEHDHVKYVCCNPLDEAGILRHGFSTRIGGVSSGVYKSLNLSFTQGDDPVAVTENMRRISACFGFTPQNIIRAKQTHTTNIRKVTLENSGSGVVRESDFQDVDGLITNEPGIMLNTLHADCTPIFLLDPVKRAIGLVHAGWKGTTGRIAFEAIKNMEEEFGSRAQDIMAYIGPCICRNCYEIGMDVALEVIESFSGGEVRESFRTPRGRNQIIATDRVFAGHNPILIPKTPQSSGKSDPWLEEKFFLDLKAANMRILLDSGLKAKNIFVSDLCTYELDELFYSHRRMGKKRGLMGAFIALQ